MSAKPTIVCVPGAWHGPVHYEPLVKRLEAAGYKTRSVELASVGAAEPLKNFDPDVERIQEAIKESVDAGENVMVLMHSYGSMPAIEAVKGFEKKGSQPIGVAHMFFCAAFVPPPGASLMDMLGGKPLPWFIVSDDEMVVNPDDPAKVFYADCGDSTQGAIDALKPFSYKTFTSKSKNRSWTDIPCTYLFCEDDQAIPLPNQQGMVDGSRADFRKVTVKASHSPFLSLPDQVATEVRRSAGESI